MNRGRYTCKPFLRIVSTVFERNYWHVQAWLLVLILLLALKGVLETPLPDGTGFMAHVVYKGALFVLVAVYAVGAASVLPFWVHMIEASPAAALRLFPSSIVSARLASLVERLHIVILPIHAWVRRERQFHAGKYSLASIFSAVLPYRLYPLSCCLLE